MDCFLEKEWAEEMSESNSSDEILTGMLRRSTRKHNIVQGSNERLLTSSWDLITSTIREANVLRGSLLGAYIAVRWQNRRSNLRSLLTSKIYIQEEGV